MLARLLLLIVLLAWPVALPAQDATTTATAIQVLDNAGREYRAIDEAFNGKIDADQRHALQDRADAVAQTADAQVAVLAAQMALVDQQVAQLGPAPAAGAEAPDIVAQRRTLARNRTLLDSAVKRGKLLEVEAQQLGKEIRDSAADAFNEKVSAHTLSPLSPRFWSLAAELLPRDLRRLQQFLGQEEHTVVRAASPWPALVGIVVALVLLLPARTLLGRLGRRLMIQQAPPTRLRRSGYALWLAVGGTLLPGLAATAFVGGLDDAGLIAASWARIGNVLIRVAYVAGAFVSLGNALLQPKLASWRLVPLEDEAARALRHCARIAAGAILATALVSALVSEVGGNGPLSIAADTLAILVSLAVVVTVLRTIAGIRREAEMPGGGDEVSRSESTALGFFALVAWGAVLFSVGALLAGYVALGLTVARLLLWWPLVAAALYLLLIACDDLCTDLVSRNSRLGHALVHGFGVRGSLLDQAGVFLSATLRLLLVALAITVATGPFGSNVTSLFDVAGQVAQGVSIGQITLSPGAMLRAVAVLAAGLFVVRLVQHWLTQSYLPATELDAGARNSVAMVVRYAGVLLAVLWALTSLGIGIERIALLLSALSVGIGFGLQAITQNFVSGLILLAERPVKIGDWVRIGTDEGDIKRISVRATEIQIADKSTLIVPNSELITKAVLNRTLADPLGRIQLQFSLMLGADVDKARTILLDIYRGTPGVLETPAPSVFVDGISDGRVALNSFAYVGSPRDVYPTRSEILFRLLSELPKAGIELGTAPQQMQIIGGTPLAPNTPAPPE